MALVHRCSRCGSQFIISLSTRLSSGWGMSLRSAFYSAQKQLEDYQKVRCPQCENVETDERIKSFGLFNPKTVIYLILVSIFVFLVFDYFAN